jgi:hypothetical protein
MSWKSIVITGLLCVVAAPAWAVPSLSFTSSYNAAQDAIIWEVRVTQDTATALAIEAPFTLANHPVITNFTPFLRDSGGDATNGAVGQTWYYNETAAGSGTLVWNTQQDAADTEQDFGNNPFTGTETEGLTIDTVARTLFAALGSDVNLPDIDGVTAGTQVATLHIASGDGILNWTDLIVAESSAQTLLTGSRNSIRARGDMNGNGTLTFADITPYTQILGAAGGIAAYNVAFLGLNGRARGDFTGEGNTTFADIPTFTSCLSGGSCGPPLAGVPGGGSGSGGGGAGIATPEPSSIVMVFFAALGLLFRPVRRTVS